MITPDEFLAYRGGSKVRARLGGTTLEQDARIASALEEAIAEFRARLSPVLGSDGRARVASLNSDNTPPIIKVKLAALCWYRLLTTLSDNVSASLQLIKAEVDEWYKAVHSGQIDLGLAPETPADRRRPKIHYRRGERRYSRAVDPFAVP